MRCSLPGNEGMDVHAVRLDDHVVLAADLLAGSNAN